MWGCIWMMSHPTFILCPSETVLLSSPICFCGFFCCSNCKKETLFNRKIWYQTLNPWDVRAQSNAQSYSELFLFSICKVSSRKQCKQGVAARPLWIVFSLLEYFQFLSNLSIKKLLLVIHVRLVPWLELVMEVPWKHHWDHPKMPISLLGTFSRFLPFLLIYY